MEAVTAATCRSNCLGKLTDSIYWGLQIAMGRPRIKSSNSAKNINREKPKRLTPTAEVLRQLYLLSGNNCAMPGCDHVITDGNGVVVGHICHIQAAMPEGARFDVNMTNEQRREASNLVLMCGGHHTQIDSKSYENEYTLAVVRKIKATHESKLKAVGSSLRKAFNDGYADVTDSLVPTKPKTFSRLETTLPYCRLEPDERPQRKKDIGILVDKMSVMPPDDRAFVLAIVRRAIKLKVEGTLLVHVDDAAASLSISQNRLKTKGDALQRYEIGDIDLYGTDRDDEPHVRIQQPSEYLTWQDIAEFCRKENLSLESFVLHLRFGALDA